MRITQKDIARLAGVSQATVSLVVSGRSVGSQRVGEDARRRVLEAIQKTGYTANPLAQGLAKGRSSIFGVHTYEAVFPKTAGDFYAPFLAGIEAEAESVGCDLLLFTSAPARRGKRRIFDEGWSRLLVTDGCVLLGRHEEKSDLRELIDADFPFVFVGRRELPDSLVPYVGVDYVRATEELVSMLADLGHERIGYVADIQPDESSQDRLAGYRRGARRFGLSPMVFDKADVDASAALMVAKSNDLTALMLETDYLANEIDATAGSLGIQIPRDLSVVVLGQSDRTERYEPGRWTGFSIPRFEVGVRAVRELVAMIEGGEEWREAPPQVLLPCDPLLGRSHGSPRVGALEAAGLA